MMGTAVHTGMRKLGAAMAALALLVSVLAGMPGQSPFPDGDLAICGHATSGGGGSDGGRDAPSGHHCDLCMLHCHVAWMPAADAFKTVEYQPADLGRVRSDNSGPALLALGEYRRPIPRGPPVFA